MAKKPGRTRVNVEASGAPIDFDTWVRRYVALLLEAERAPATVAATAAVAGVR